MKYYKFLIIIVLLFTFGPSLVFAQIDKSSINTVFKAEVVEIIKQETGILPDLGEATQQDLKLLGLEGDYKSKEVIFNGIGNYSVINQPLYKVGDRVLVVASAGANGMVQFYVTDYVRTAPLLWLSIIFIVSLLTVGRFKGLRSLFALALTFLVMIKYMVPQILSGANPLVITAVSSIIILVIIIYLTEGFSRRSHIAMISIFISLGFTMILAWLFVYLAKISGVASEDVAHLVNIGDQAINFQGLLLAGIIIGTLGVLDDVVISQVATTEELVKADRYLSAKEVFKKTYRVGVSHISSMTNTLFLAYVGVSFPLLILLVSGESAFSSWIQVINNEVIATEIIRTLAGSIGLILAVPISTALAAWWYTRR